MREKPENPDPASGEASKVGSTEVSGKGAEEYEVGLVRPPRNTRWKKGGPSPNPRGRPRKQHSVLPDFTRALEQALNKKVWVSRGDRKVFLTRLEIGLEQLLNQFAAGDRHARDDLVKLAERAGLDLLAKHKQGVEEALALNHQAILDAYVARRTGAANVAAATPVLAPAELLDDEPDETEQPESSRRSASRPSGTNEPIKENVRQEPRAMQPAQKLDQASYGAGRPPPGGFSVTTRKPT
jgi:hypothetical protein